MNPQPKPVPREKKARRPLKRKRYMRKRAPRRLSRAGSDPAYLAWVRTQSCVVASVRCSGPIHAHHAIHRSQGGKDDSAIPLCMVHHRDWHTNQGPFFTLSKMERWAWSQMAIAEVARRRQERP